MKDLWIILGALAFLVIASLTIGSVNAAEVTETAASTVTLETKAVELLGKAEQGVVALSEKIQALATAHGGEAWEMGETVARIDAASSLVPGFLSLLIGCILGWMVVKSFRHNYDAKSYCSTDIIMLHFFMGLFPAVGLIGGLIGVSNLWAWVGVFEPTIWMAKVALGL